MKERANRQRNTHSDLKTDNLRLIKTSTSLNAAYLYKENQRKISVWTKKQKVLQPNATADGFRSQSYYSGHGYDYVSEEEQ